MAEIYRFSKKDGVLGWRPTGKTVTPYDAGVLRIDPIGLAVDGETQLWQWTHESGRTTVYDGVTNLDINYRPAVRITHPELGSILYVDNAKPAVRLRTKAVLWEDETTEPVYFGISGSIENPIEPLNGIRYQTTVGPSIVIAQVPA